MKGLSKEYATRVLDGVDLDVRSGEIHGLLGANGAGKSTLCKIIAGLTDATSGSMQLAGQPYAPASKSQAEALGIQIVQQELNLIPTLDVAHNLYFSRLPNRWGVISRKTLYANARALLDQFGMTEIKPATLVGSLGVGQQQMIEIAGTLGRDCQVLILDEPTAALSPGETDLLVEHLRRAKSRGVGIIVISHRLDEIQAWTDRVTILRDGQLVGTYQTNELTQSGMIQAMTGGDGTTNQSPNMDAEPAQSTSSNRSTIQANEAVFKFNNLCRAPWVRDVSFEVHAGEVLGIGGLVGSGRSELLRLIFGADRADSGTIEIGGQVRAPFSSTTQAVQHGIVMVGEDRKRDGLLLAQTITDNVVLASLFKPTGSTGLTRLRSRLGVYFPKAAASVVQQLGEQLRIHCHSLRQSVGTLSGGNQQKVVLAKWMLRGGNLFLLDEPTRGIDVSARQQVYELINQLAGSGQAVVVVSSDLEELMQISHRIGILSAGRWTGHYQRHEFQRVELVRAMFEGYRNRQQVVPT